MSAMPCLPTIAQQREVILAELRVQRLRQQLVVAHIDLIATGVKCGLVPPEGVPLLLAELFGTAEEPAE